MKKKNEIEQELDEKEFEQDLDRHLKDEYRRRKIEDQKFRDANPYVIAGMNFAVTILFFEVLYWLLKTLFNAFTLHAFSGLFTILDPVVHLAVLVLGITAIIKRKSAVEVVVDRWPF